MTLLPYMCWLILQSDHKNCIFLNLADIVWLPQPEAGSVSRVCAQWFLLVSHIAGINFTGIKLLDHQKLCGRRWIQTMSMYKGNEERATLIFVGQVSGRNW